MGGKVNVPGPSQAEQDLQKAQADLLKQQRDIVTQQQAQQKVLLPFLAEQEGFDVTMDENGNISGIKKKDDPLAAQNKEITSLLNERSLHALKGDLPVDPALEQSLGISERGMREKLASQFGPGYETSSPAIEELQKFQNSAEQLRYGARTGQLTLSEQLGLTRQQQNISSQGISQDVLMGSAVSNPMSFAGAFGQIARGYGQAQMPYIQQRQMETQAATSNSDRMFRLFGAGMGAAGQMGAAYMMSDPDLKEDLILVSDKTFPIYEYTLRTTGERMLGVLSRDVEAKLPAAIAKQHGFDVVAYGAVEWAE